MKNKYRFKFWFRCKSPEGRVSILISKGDLKLYEDNYPAITCWRPIEGELNLEEKVNNGDLSVMIVSSNSVMPEIYGTYEFEEIKC